MRHLRDDSSVYLKSVWLIHMCDRILSYVPHDLFVSETRLFEVSNTLQHTATHCNTLQHTATHCNTLQHTATHYNTLFEVKPLTCIYRVHTTHSHVWPWVTHVCDHDSFICVKWLIHNRETRLLTYQICLDQFWPCHFLPLLCSASLSCEWVMAHIWMSHGKYVNESWSHMWKSHVLFYLYLVRRPSPVNESWHTWKRVMVTRVIESCFFCTSDIFGIPPLWMSYGTHENATWYICEWVMAHMRMSHGHTCEWVMSFSTSTVFGVPPLWMSHGTHVNASWHTCKWVMVTYVNESWHAWKWVVVTHLNESCPVLPLLC